MSLFSNPAASSVEQAREYTAAVLNLLGSQDAMEVLRRTPAKVPEVIAGLSERQVGQPEAPGKWPISFVLQHLADSELVWGYRLRMVLAHERPRLTGYDQDLWAERLHYTDADAQQALNDFGVLRQANLRLLAAASPTELSRSGIHEERGEESLEHMVRLYAGHDLVHLRQLARIRQAIVNAS